MQNALLMNTSPFKDILLENLAGVEMLKQLTVSTDPEMKFRILLVRWMFTHGFLESEFPATERYSNSESHDEHD